MAVSRKTVHLGDDRFAIDSDRKVYRNGYGQTYPGSYLSYDQIDKAVTVRVRIRFDILFKYLHEHNLEPKEAIRRTRIAMSHLGERKRTAQASDGNQKRVYCTTERKVFRSIQAASGHYGLTANRITRAARKKKEVDGLRFKMI
jgi:hypothetical protein